jgi:hypothetical protein
MFSFALGLRLWEGQPELHYDWRFIANQFTLAPRSLKPTTSFSFSTEPLQSQSLCNILSDERIGLSFTIAAGRRQRSYSRI